MGRKDITMQTSSPPDVETVHLEGAVTLTRTRIVEPRRVSAAEALFRERVIEIEIEGGCVALTPDPA